MLYILGFFVNYFCQITFKRLTYTNIKHTKYIQYKTNIQLYKRLGVCVCQVTLQTTAIYVYEHLIYFLQTITT